jgi:hypothetical protein
MRVEIMRPIFRARLGIEAPHDTGIIGHEDQAISDGRARERAPDVKALPHRGADRAGDGRIDA